MKTEIIDVSDGGIEGIDKAAALLKQNELVAFPTETVYGIGACGLSEEAVSKIFTAKGRPSDNPLILHIADMNDLEKITKNIKDYALKLMDKFWPGPITFVLERTEIVPLSVCAGLDTVAVRFPSNEISMKLIRAAGFPIAAPSANTSGKPSPTDAKAVYEDLNGKIPLILDGGETEVGLESTVVLVTGDYPIVLRHGKVTIEELREIMPDTEDSQPYEPNDDFVPLSPGQKYRHYAPKAEMYAFKGKFNDISNRILLEEAKYELQNKKVGILCFDETRDRYTSENVLSVGSYFNKEEVSHNLFSVLREFDRLGVDVILSETMDERGLGKAIMNRLTKACGGNIISV